MLSSPAFVCDIVSIYSRSEFLLRLQQVKHVLASLSRQKEISRNKWVSPAFVRRPFVEGMNKHLEAHGCRKQRARYTQNRDVLSVTSIVLVRSRWRMSAQCRLSSREFLGVPDLVSIDNRSEFLQRLKQVYSHVLALLSRQEKNVRDKWVSPRFMYRPFGCVEQQVRQTQN